MAVNINDYLYPFDPTGAATTNKVVNEQHILTAVNYRDYQFIVPRMSPFFVDSIVMEYKSTTGQVRTLVEGVDFYFSHWFISASRACAKPIYGSISFLDTNLAGVITLKSYQTLGGMWNLDEQKIAEILADRIHNPRTTSWDSVSDMPAKFPVIDHEWDLVDMVGASELRDACLEIRDAILASKGSGSIADHLINYNNPHRTNKGHVGLSNVENYAPANDAEALGNRSDLYMTPRAVQLALASSGAAAGLQAHIQNQNNPHGTTPAKIGAYDKTEVNNLLADKLDRLGAAEDSKKFDGKTPAEFIALVLTGTAANSVRFNNKSYEEVRADYMAGRAGDTSKVFGMTQPQFDSYIDGRVAQGGNTAQQKIIPSYSATNPTGPGSWTALGLFEAPAAGGGDSDMLLMVAGGEATVNQPESPLLVVRVTSDNNAIPVVKVKMVDDVMANVTIGFTPLPNGTQYTLWLKSGPDRNQITTTILQEANGDTYDENTTQVVETEPAGIVYANTTSSNYVTQGQLEAVLDALTQSFNTAAQGL